MFAHVAAPMWSLLSALGGAAGGALLVFGIIGSGRRYERERRLARIVDGANDAIIGKTLAGVITDWNPAAERLFGYRADEALGRKIRDLIIPVALRAEEAEILARLSRGEIVPHFRTQRRHKDGSLIDVSVSASPLYASDGRVVGASKTVCEIAGRVRAERAAFEAQERLRRTTQLTGIALWDYDEKTGTLRWDDTLPALYGRASADFPPSVEGWRSAVDPGDLSNFDAVIGAARVDSAPFDTTFRVVTPAGDLRYMRAKGMRLYDPARQSFHVLGVNFDVTLEKTREIAIAELNAELEARVAQRTADVHRLAHLQRAILADAALAIIAAQADGTITLVNPAAERMLGYAAEELVGRTTPLILHDAHELNERAAELTIELGTRVEAGLGVFIAKARHGEPDARAWTYLKKDGTRFPVLLTITALRDADGTIFGYLGMAVDISEAQRAQSALAESERFIKAVTNHIPGLVGYWDADLRCRFSNEEYRRWFGRGGEAVLGLHISELLPADILALNKPHIAAALRGEPQHFERRLIRRDGSVGYTLAHFIPDVDGEGVRGFYVLVTDVTEIKQAQQHVLALNEALEARTREAESATASKSQFLANMSHEIRSPMNAILGMLQLLQTTQLSTRQADYAAKACAATQSLLHLLNDILDFSKIEAGRVALESVPFDLEDVMRDVSSLVSVSLGTKAVEIVFDVDGLLPDGLRGDAFRLRQVLLNIAENAIKFTTSGEVVVAVRTVDAACPGRCDLEFAVADTGIGIAPEHLEAIFGGFAQAEASTTRRFGGTGLGLTISERLVSLMGGTLRVESELGKGTRFSFTLGFDRVDPQARPQPVGGDSGGPLRVLVVDDNDRTRAALMTIARSLGWVVDGARNGAEAFERIRAVRDGRGYDVLLVDWRMPGLDGWETCRRVREARTALGATAIAMVTSAAVAELAARTNAEPGVIDGVLIKPVTASALIDAVLEARAGETLRPARGRPAKAPRLCGRRLIVIEDEAINLQVVSELLALEGAEVTCADNARAGIAAVLAADPPFDLVLMDLQMPEMDGYEATRILRQSPAVRDIPIVALTANATEHDKAACRNAGMNAHIPKPIDIESTVATILLQLRMTRSARSRTPEERETRGPARVIDLEGALRRMGSNTQLFAHVADQFIEAAPQVSEAMRAAFAAGALADVAEILHELSIVARTIGNMPLAEFAARLDGELTTTNRLSDAETKIAHIGTLIETGNAELSLVIEHLRSS